MLFTPKSITGSTLPADELKTDRKEALRFEDCGLGKKALYIGWLGLDCMRYLPIAKVQRVYKRLAVSKGFFEEGKIFGTLSYLVVQHDGRETVVRFTHEENLDAMLDTIRANTQIPVGKK